MVSFFSSAKWMIGTELVRSHDWLTAWIHNLCWAIYTYSPFFRRSLYMKNFFVFFEKKMDIRTSTLVCSSCFPAIPISESYYIHVSLLSGISIQVAANTITYIHVSFLQHEKCAGAFFIILLFVKGLVTIAKHCVSNCYYMFEKRF